jgi:hypothetical protein
VPQRLRGTGSQHDSRRSAEGGHVVPVHDQGGDVAVQPVFGAAKGAQLSLGF